MTTVASQNKPLPRETFLPQIGRILHVEDMTAKDRFFRIELKKPLGHRPGQFVMVSILGLGEAPISISNGPTGDNILEMVIRRIGRLTQAIHQLKAGDTLGIRGPYGSGFNLEDFYGKDVLFIAGGLGLFHLVTALMLAGAPSLPHHSHSFGAAPIWTDHAHFGLP